LLDGLGTAHQGNADEWHADARGAWVRGVDRTVLYWRWVRTGRLGGIEAIEREAEAGDS
jgi:hypothetical protein